MKDTLGDRMKEFYEDRTRFMLGRRTYTIIRIDGKSFHTYTRGLKRPFDEDLITDIDATTIHLCKNIMGAKFGYVQSDEISIVLTDFDENETQAWFDNNLQKMCSISASLATEKFNKLRLKRYISDNYPEFSYHSLLEEIENFKAANFDSRVFQISYSEEVVNYFIWRQQDATRNSISSVAQSLYSHKELHGKSTNDMQEMIFQKGQNWNDYPSGQKRGRIILKETYEKPTDINIPNSKSTTRTRWVAVDPPIFTQDKNFLLKML